LGQTIFVTLNINPKLSNECLETGIKCNFFPQHKARLLSLSEKKKKKKKNDDEVKKKKKKKKKNAFCDSSISFSF